MNTGRRRIEIRSFGWVCQSPITAFFYADLPNIVILPGTLVPLATVIVTVSAEPLVTVYPGLGFHMR